jgi:hypothetical protein
MLEREEYRRSWEKKLAWYRANKVLPAEEGGGENGMLVTSQDSAAAGFNLAHVQASIQKYLK